MAPHGEAMVLVSSYTPSNNFNKPRRLSNDNLKRTTSDISFELSKEAIDVTLPPISEIEDAKCECCGMVEEYTLEYVDKVRGKFCGKWICGLCAEAVKEEMEKNGGKREEALEAHMNACFRFNKFGRAYPVLSQAQAMREMFRKSVSMDGRGARVKSAGPKDKKGQIARSSSCIPAITREMNDIKLGN